MDAVSVKDNLLQQLNACNGEYFPLINYATNLVIIMNNTAGLWIELEYAYKAKEIIDLTIRELSACVVTYSARRKDVLKSLNQTRKLFQ